MIYGQGSYGQGKSGNFEGVGESQGKLFISSGKVKENEFCKVVGTLYGDILGDY